MPFFMAQTFHNIWMSMTAFGISLFRFTCIWDNLLIFEKDKLKHLMKHIFVGEVIITSGLVSLSKSYFWFIALEKTCRKKFLMISATFGVYLSQKALALDFCYGYGQELTSIIQEYNEIDEEIASFGKVMVQMSILITFLFVNGTLFLYGFIFIHLFKTNKINKVGKYQLQNLW